MKLGLRTCLITHTKKDFTEYDHREAAKRKSLSDKTNNFIMCIHKIINFNFFTLVKVICIIKSLTCKKQLPEFHCFQKESLYLRKTTKDPLEGVSQEHIRLLSHF